MKRTLYIVMISILALMMISCTKKEDKVLALATNNTAASTTSTATTIETAPAAESASATIVPVSSVEVKTDKLTGKVFSNRKDTYATYDERTNSQREKMGPAAYPNGSQYDRFVEVVTDFMGTRRQAGYDYLISYTFMENGFIEILFGGEYMYGTYTLKGNDVYIDDGKSLLCTISEDGYSLENKLIEGTLYLELPIVGTFTNSHDMMMDYLALFNEEMNKNNITSYDDEVFTDWFMLTYGNVAEYAEYNSITATFLENGWVYILTNETSKFSQYEFDDETPNYINVDGVPMFAMYEGGYDIMPLFQHSIMTRIEMPEETKKYL